MTRPPEAQHLYDPTGRWYKVPLEVLQRLNYYDPSLTIWLPAVSSVLDVYQPPYLREWYGRKGIQEAERIRDETAGWGTQTHQLVKYIIQGNKVETWDGIPEPVRNGLRAWVRWNIQSRFQPVATELIVYSLKYGYAGTLDAAGLMYGVPAIADWKTSYRSDVDLLDWLQVAAYMQALRETYPTLIKPKQGRLVILNRETGDFAEYHKGLWEMREAFNCFLAAHKVWRYTKKSADATLRDQALRLQESQSKISKKGGELDTEENSKEATATASAGEG
jgi:hypothetical protein